MNIPEIVGVVVGWVEDHEHTVDLLKWIIAGLIAWALGLFRAVRAWARRPSISIEPSYSQCYLVQYETLHEHTDVALLVFILDAEVMNPTSARIGVRKFELQVKRFGMLKRWTMPVTSIGFPSMPRTPMPGDKVKVIPIWLTSFPDYDVSLTNKHVDAQDSDAGLIFFSILVPKKIVQLDMTECFIKVSITFSTGEKRTTKAAIKVLSDLAHLDQRVPGSEKYVQHHSVWKHCT